MEYYVQQNDNCCLLTCFAMLLNVLPRELVTIIGSDGSEELSDGVHRGHHMVELIDISIRHYQVHPFVIECYPVNIHEDFTVEFDEIELYWYLERYNGILLYDEHCGVHQYKKPDKIYNPVGKKIPLLSIIDQGSGFIGFP